MPPFVVPFILMAIVLLLRLLLMGFLDIIDDEAYHWTWAQYLNISYFDHPGIVGWSIRPFTSMFGHSPFVLRIPGMLYLLGILVFVYRLSLEMFTQRTAAWTALMVLFVPLWGFASLGTLPDVPLGFFWIAAAYIFWQGVREDGKAWSTRTTWLCLGIVMGLGMNSKLTCSLIGLGMGLYLLTSPKSRRQLLTPWPYVATAITFVMMFPIFYWNSNNSWATFRYQFMRRHTEDFGANWGRWWEFIGIQSIFMSPGIYVFMIFVFFLALFRWKDIHFRLLWCLASPALMIFYYQPLWAAYKPHWSGPSYLLLFILSMAVFIEGLGAVKACNRWIASVCVIFLVPLNLLYIPLLTPVIPRIVQASVKNLEWEPKNDFSNEFYGWTEAGKFVLSLAERIQQESGVKPLIGAQRYELISQLTWGLARATTATGNKVSFDVQRPLVWAITNESNQFYYDQFAHREWIWGKDFLIVNNDKYPRNPMDFADFDSCEKTELPIYRKAFDSAGYLFPEEESVLARTFFIFHCKNLKHIH